jgi:hypothetical protein
MSEVAQVSGPVGGICHRHTGGEPFGTHIVPTCALDASCGATGFGLALIRSFLDILLCLPIGTEVFFQGFLLEVCKF